MRKIFASAIFLMMLIIPQCVFASVETAQSACVMNAVTGEIVFEKNANERLPMASTTKIMTAYVALKNSSLDDLVTVSKNAANQEGSGMYIEADEQFYMEDLLYGLMLNSGNDAAVAIAEYISGDCDKFADLMNRTAWEMGAGDTSFCNPNGLPHDYHFTTAADLALITKNAMELPEFRTIVATKSRTVWPAWPKDKPIDLYNHNKLLSEYEGAIGVKTGYTEAAGRCLVSAAERNGMTFIAVTLNDSDDWNTHKQLLDSAFEAHHPQKAIKKGETLKKMIVDGKTYSFSAADDFIVPVKDNEKKHINAELHIASNLKGAVNKGEKVGYVQLKCDGKNIGSVDIVSDSEIQEINNYRLKGSFYEAWRNIWDFFLV